MFISLTDLIIQENDDATYVSVIVIDPMQRPEKTLRFDKTNKNDFGKWIQVGLEIHLVQIQKSNLIAHLGFDLSLLKLSRSAAIFEFSSLSPSASFNMKFECRSIELLRKGYLRLIFINHLLFLTSKCKTIIKNNI